MRHISPRLAEGADEIHAAIAWKHERDRQFPSPLPPPVQIAAGPAVGIRPSAEGIFESLHGYTVVIVARQSVPGEKAVSSIIPVKTS